MCISLCMSISLYCFSMDPLRSEINLYYYYYYYYILHIAVLARLSREMFQVVRIDCHSFLSRIRISVRPSKFLIGEKKIRNK